MGSNYFTPFADLETQFTDSALNAPLIEHDRLISRTKDVFISCLGTMSYTPSTTILAWTDDIIIHYVDADGDLIKNVVDFSDGGGAASIDITTGYYVYVTLSTADAEVVPAEADIVKDAAATSIPYNRLVLGYTDDQDIFYPSKHLAQIWANNVTSFGEISAHENATATVLAAQDTDYQVVIFDTNGLSNNMTPDHTTDDITVIQTGSYLCTISFSFNSGTANNYIFHMSKNNNAAEFANLHAERTTGVASAFGSASVSGIATLTAADTIEFWVRRTDGAGVSKSLVVKNITMSLLQIRGT